MALKFNMPANQAAARETYVVYGNAGNVAEPDWVAIGTRVEDSSAELDWSAESIVDILGNKWTSLKSPTISQTFDPLPLVGEDKFQEKIWELAIGKQDAQSLANLDLLRVHTYTDDGNGGAFAERYPASSVVPTGLGGEGGGNLTMPIDVTFGGVREIGTAKVAEGKVTFTANPEVFDAV